MFAPRTGVSFLSPEENSVSAVVQTRKRGNLCFSLARMYNYSPPLGGHPACSGIGSIMAGMPPPRNRRIRLRNVAGNVEK